MTIHIKNTQRTIKLDVKKIQKQVKLLLETLEYEDFDIGIWFTSNQTIRKYNRTYRNKDKPTDILSFAYHPKAKPSKRIIVQDEEDKNLGDLIIAPAFVRADASRWKMTFEERIPILLIHGILHLLGYDHEDDRDFRIMRKKEILLLQKLQKNSLI